METRREEEMEKRTKQERGGYRNRRGEKERKM